MKRSTSISEAFTLGKNKSQTVPTCASPVCKVEFEQTGIMRLEPRRYCNDRCKLNAWAIRRVKKLLDGLSDDKVIEMLRQR